MFPPKLKRQNGKLPTKRIENENSSLRNTTLYVKYRDTKTWSKRSLNDVSIYTSPLGHVKLNSISIQRALFQNYQPLESYVRSQWRLLSNIDTRAILEFVVYPFRQVGNG
jgi:hypothetical protein